MLSRKVFYGAALAALVVFMAGFAVYSAAAASALPAGGGAAVMQSNAPAAQTGGTAVRTITVVGTGKASGAPDVAHVTVGVEAAGPALQAVVDDNKTRMTTLLAALKAQGIADKDIRTTNYNVYVENPQPPQPMIEGGGKAATPALTYHVTNQVDVTVRDVAKLGDLLDKVVAAGANNIYGVSFSVDDPTKLQGMARADAIADAKARAQDLAGLTGVTLGDVISVSEVIGSPGPVFAAAVEARAYSAAAPVPIQTGELEVSMNVQVTYAIK
jgi:uncharacterized protein YggE